MAWHDRSIDEILEDLGSSRKGLNDQEASSKLEENGLNAIESGEEISPLKIFLSQFQNFLIYLLIGAALISVGV